MPRDHRGGTARPRGRALSRRHFALSLSAAPVLASCLDPFAEFAHDERDDDPPWRASSALSVLEPALDQTLSQAQHCSLSSELAGLVAVGDQIRITRSASEYALYTVTELRDEDQPGLARMTSAGRQRLGTSGTFAAVLDTVLTANELDDDDAHAQSEFVERLVDDGVHDELLVTAAHGGRVESYTDRQAERMAATLAGISSWICKGWRSPSGAFSRWHISSTELSPNSFPGLGVLSGRGFSRVVSFHGMSSAGVLIGGRAPVELREQLRGAIVDAIADPSVEVVVSGEDGPHAGVSSNNFVNWLSAGGEAGIQIEQSYVVRTQHWAAIADAVAATLGAG